MGIAIGKDKINCFIRGFKDTLSQKDSLDMCLALAGLLTAVGTITIGLTAIENPEIAQKMLVDFLAPAGITELAMIAMLGIMGGTVSAANCNLSE